MLNINLPATAAEAVTRTRRALELFGRAAIKLEVLDASHARSKDSEVLAAVTELAADADGLEIWPLVTADPVVVRELEAQGCGLIRVIGSEIGSGRGIDQRQIRKIEEILTAARVPMMLDGGVGTPEDVSTAFELGFDCVLVNSCLFADGGDPVARLLAMRDKVEAFSVTQTPGASY
jgi:thiazole synthase